MFYGKVKFTWYWQVSVTWYCSIKFYLNHLRANTSNISLPRHTVGRWCGTGLAGWSFPPSGSTPLQLLSIDLGSYLFSRRLAGFSTDAAGVWESSYTLCIKCHSVQEWSLPLLCGRPPWLPSAAALTCQTAPHVQGGLWDLVFLFIYF